MDSIGILSMPKLINGTIEAGTADIIICQIRINKILHTSNLQTCDDLKTIWDLHNNICYFSPESISNIHSYHFDLRDYISDTTCRCCRKHAWRLTWCISHYHARIRFWITIPITTELFRCLPGLIIDHFFTILFNLIVCCR